MERERTQSYRQIGHNEKVYAVVDGREVCLGKRQDMKRHALEASFPMVTLLNGKHYPWPQSKARKMYGYHRPLTDDEAELRWAA